MSVDFENHMSLSIACWLKTVSTLSTRDTVVFLVRTLYCICGGVNPVVDNVCLAQPTRGLLVVCFGFCVDASKELNIRERSESLKIASQSGDSPAPCVSPKFSARVRRSNAVPATYVLIRVKVSSSMNPNSLNRSSTTNLIVHQGYKVWMSSVGPGSFMNLFDL